MDKLNTKGIGKGPKKGLWKRIVRKAKNFLASARNFDKIDKRELCYDLVMFSIGFLLSRCHVIFGAHPLGLAFLCCLPASVWPSLLGAVIGAFSLGGDGIIFAAVCAIAVFLRAAISAKDGEDGSIKLFGEGLLARMSTAVICGFISGVYEVVVSGLNESTLLFGISMVVFPPILCFILFGVFSCEINLRTIVFEPHRSLSISEAHRTENYSALIFQLCSLMLMFFIGMSFRGVDMLGISVAYLFSALITLICAKKFGALRAMAVGFASSLSISPTLSVAFALAGLGAGALFGLGSGYAVAVGGVALGAFSAYSSGLSGLLATMPEYIIATTIALPILKKVTPRESQSPNDTSKKQSEDMVGTMALLYQSEYSGSLDFLQRSLYEMSDAMKNFCTPPDAPNFDDYRNVVIDIAQCHCIGCPGSGLCSAEGIRPCIKNADKIASLLQNKKRILPEDVNTDTEFCQMARVIAESINRECSRVEENYLRTKSLCDSAEKYKVIYEMMSEAKRQDNIEKSVNNDMNDQLSAAVESCGLTDCTIRSFGKRRRRFFVSACDPSGEKITSDKLRTAIEDVASVKLGKPDFFRKGDMVIMECGVRAAYKVSAAFASSAGQENQVSGDCIRIFETANDVFLAVISDGMGSGEIAYETADFVCRSIEITSCIGEAWDGIFHMINQCIQERGVECSASIDLFEFDRVLGEGVFIKSGAAPSYIKRESSIFRIRSQSAPIGLMKSIDCEKTKAEIKAGDHIIMLSDGIADDTDDAPWLLLLLGETPPKDLKDYADLIISEAKKNSKSNDDMSVIVMRIDEA